MADPRRMLRPMMPGDRLVFDMVMAHPDGTRSIAEWPAMAWEVHPAYVVVLFNANGQDFMQAMAREHVRRV